MADCLKAYRALPRRGYGGPYEVRWKRHGKKGRRGAKSERAPGYYATHWWDQR